MTVITKATTVWIGTSGIALSGNKQSFPLAFRNKSRLSYYSSIFNSVEINSSFYKVPQATTMVRWAGEAGPGFKFTVKLWKEITHVKELKFKLTDVQYFMNRLTIPVGSRGCLLVQFPGKIGFDYYKKVKKLLEILAAHNNADGWRICIEFRHLSWYNDETYAMLRSLKIALVLHDKSALHKHIIVSTADVVYVRLHGPKGDYKGSYSTSYLTSLAKKLLTWKGSGRDVYIYFNNTIGKAYQNAKLLQTLTGK